MNQIDATVIWALDFSAQRHKGQTRKGKDNTPYINHPIQVVALLTKQGEVDAPLLMAAALHDVIEDTASTPEQIEALSQTIEAEFGGQVLAIVKEVSDDKNLPFSERKRLQVINTPNLSDEAKKLKIADKTCNIMDMIHEPPTGWSRERKLGYLDWARQVIDGARGVNPRLESEFDYYRQQAYRHFSQTRSQ